MTQTSRSTKHSSSMSSVPAICPRVCSHSGSARIIGGPSRGHLALDLFPALLALLGAFAWAATSEDRAGDLTRADDEAGGAHTRLDGECAGGFGRRLDGAGGVLQRFQHGHDFIA